MKNRIFLGCAALIASLLCLPALAQTPTGMGGMSGMGPGMQAGTTQQGMGPGMGGPGRKAPRDCAKSPNPERCEARKQAASQCQGQAGPAFRQCMQDKMPPMDCSKAPDPKRCELHQKAREACKDKLGPEHRQCLRDQFAGK